MYLSIHLIIEVLITISDPLFKKYKKDHTARKMKNEFQNS